MGLGFAYIPFIVYRMDGFKVMNGNETARDEITHIHIHLWINVETGMESRLHTCCIKNKDYILERKISWLIQFHLFVRVCVCAWLVIEFSLLCRIYSSNSTLQCGSIFRIISKPFPTKEIDYHADVQTAWQFDAHQNLIDKMKIINDCAALLKQLQAPPQSLWGRWCSVTSWY